MSTHTFAPAVNDIITDTATGNVYRVEYLPFGAVTTTAGRAATDTLYTLTDLSTGATVRIALGPTFKSF
jgi:hypothetical protein